MANYFSLRDGLITDTSTYGISISSVEKTTNSTSYTLTTSDNWSTVLSSVNTDVIDSIVVHLNSRAATPVGVLSAQTMQYAGSMIRGSTNISTSDSPFVGYDDGSMSLDGTTTTFSRRTDPITFTGDFTIEMWIFPTITMNSNRMLCECFTATPTVAGWQLYFRGGVGSGNSIAFLVNNSTATRVQGSTPIAANNWYHVAVTREGNNTRMYINGVHEAVSTTIPATITSTAPFNIGTQNSGANNIGFIGFIYDVRIVNGTALYTGTNTFQRPIAPLTVVAGTQFLLQKPYNAYKNSATYALSNVGTYPISSFTSYDGSNNSVASYPLNWQLLKLSAPFTNSSGFFSLNLKTSDANQLSLMALSTVNGVDYDRMAIADSLSSVTSNYLLSSMNGPVTLSSASPFGVGIDGSMMLSGTGLAGSVSNYILLSSANITTDFRNTDFTMEGWFYFKVNNVGYQPLISYNDDAADIRGMSLVVETNNIITFGATINGTTWTYTITTGIIPTINTWTHLAIVRLNGYLYVYVNGVSRGTPANIGNNSIFTNANTKLKYGYYAPIMNRTFNGFISNIRIAKRGLYASNFTVPTSPFKDSSFDIVLKHPYALPYAETIVQQIEDIHIGGSLNGFISEPRTIQVDSDTAYNIYIHNKGTLNFPLTSNVKLNLCGSNGIQVTSDGRLNVGSSSESVPLSTTHEINLSSNHLGVHNGGRLDVYGAYKVPYTKLTTPSLSTARTFTVTDAVSSNWMANDTVVFTPNTAVSTSYDTLTLSSFDSDSTFRTTTSAQFAHSVINYVPNVANMTRNVKIKGLSTTARGSIRAKDNAVVNINNAEFSNISTNLVAGVFGNGSFSLSGCTLSGTGTENSFTFPETYYASVFNGTSTSIQTPTNNSDFQVASGTDFTFEVFIKPATSNADERLIQFADYPWVQGASWTIGFGLDLFPTLIRFNSITTTTSNLLTASRTLLKVNDWNHIAVVATSGTSNLYVNGILRHSAPQVTWNYANTYRLNIGYQNFGAGSLFYTGRMSNLRFVKGLAVYTSNFTPPTEPLKEITGAGISTAVLTLQDQLVVDNSSRRASLTRNNLTTVLDSPYFTRNAKNYYLNNNVCFKAQYGLNFQDSNQTNNIITNNLFLSSKDAGVYIKNLSSGSSVVINNNINVGPSRFGTYLEGNVSNTTIGGFVNYNNTTGLYISGNNIGKINNAINTHNSLDGVNINASTSNLSGLTFENIICYNNKADGFTVSGNNLNPLTPVILNINGLTANNNFAHGIEAYNITGNLSLLTLNDNISGGIRTSIGNGPTIFDGLTSILSSTPMNILSALNYEQTIIKNALLSSSFLNNTALNINVNKLEDFRLQNSILSASNPLNITNFRPKIEGSYLFYNCNSDAYNLSSIALNNYQSNTFTETGISVINENGLSETDTRYLAAGIISYDKTVKHTISNPASEKLEPLSDTIKLRSSSKLIPVKSGDILTISVYIKKSLNYTGSAPRLMMVGNSSLGYSDKVLATSTSPNDTWELLSGLIPTSTNKGIVEIYVDCSGLSGSGTINIDTWNFI